MSVKKMSFAAAMKDYFGPKPGDNSMGFLQELKALTSEDKAWFRENLPLVGYEITQSV
jgi:uncharacterized protein (DUF2461 family)